MITILSKLFIRDNKNYEEPRVRNLYGILTGFVGIFLNIVLFGIKFFAGIISGSVAITADAFNNLSDAGSSLVTLIGFKLAAKKPDPDHPFGHGRMEYIAGIGVAALIFLMGFSLLRDSISKIIEPESTELSLTVVIILVISILVKLYMAFYNFTTAKKIDSGTMKATGIDSLSDIVATSVTLISIIITHFTGVMVDGYAGVIVSLFIIYAGVQAIKEVISPLLGEPPSAEFVKQIEDMVMDNEEVMGIHDLVVHNYGPGRVMITLHVEVPAKSDLLEIHDVIDRIEVELGETLNCHATIHMDPVEIDNPEVIRLKGNVLSICEEISREITLHDFRVVPGTTHTNIIFDVVNPYTADIADEELVKDIREAVYTKIGENYNCVITVDKPYATK